MDKQPTRQKCQGFDISIYPEYESTESRLARGDWQSQIIGYRYTIRKYNIIKPFEREGFASYEMALQDVQNRIDAMIDSL